jgi:AcrR family transcriptional regulator
VSADATRARLLEAAIAAIDEGGEAAVSVEEIARAAGVTAPTIYNHFRNRDGLIAEAQAVRFDHRLTEDFGILGAWIEHVTTREQFLEVSEAIFSYLLDAERRDWRLDRISAIGSAVGRPALAAIVAAKFDHIVEQFSTAMRPLQDRGLIRPEVDLVAYAAWFAGAVTGRIFIELGPTSVDADAWDRVFREAALAVVLPPETG